MTRDQGFTNTLLYGIVHNVGNMFDNMLYLEIDLGLQI